MAATTVKKYLERYHALYECQKKKRVPSEETARVLGDYVKRWQG